MHNMSTNGNESLRGWLRRTLGLTLVVLGFTSVRAWPQGQSTAQITREASPAVVLIKSTTATEPVSGSGFLVSSNGRTVQKI